MKYKILQKAIDLFLKLGFKSVTMDDIAKDMAISKKTIYTHFSTKEKLVKAAALQVFEQINTGIENICTLNKNPIEEIYAIKSLVMVQLKDDRSSPQHQLQKYYPKIFEDLKMKQFESVKKCVSNNLKRGIEKEIYRKEINISLMTRLYFNGIMGIKNIELFPVKEFDQTYLMQNYLEYHFRAITTTKGLKILTEIIEHEKNN